MLGKACLEPTVRLVFVLHVMTETRFYFKKDTFKKNSKLTTAAWGGGGGAGQKNTYKCIPERIFGRFNRITF